MSHGALAVTHINWGDAPTWVSSILSGVSVLLALSIIRRDRRATEESQARRIQCITDIDPWASILGNVHRIVVRNGSDAHIMDLRIRLYPKGYLRMFLEYDRWEREHIWDDAMIRALDQANMQVFQHNMVEAGIAFRTAALMPGDEKELVIPVGVLGGKTLPFRDIQTLLEFRDPSNNVWQRDVITGRLRVRRYNPAKTVLGFKVGLILVIILLAPLVLIKASVQGARHLLLALLGKSRR